MSLEQNRTQSLEYQPQVPCYSETFQETQEQQYLPDTSTTEPIEYEAVSSTSNFNSSLGIDSDTRFVCSESDNNVYPLMVNEAAYIPQNGVHVGDNYPDTSNAIVRPSITREFVSASGEKFVLSHLVQLPTANGKNTVNEGTKKRKRTRTAFTDAHIKKLEEEYAANRYLDQPRRQYIAKALNLLERTVKIWFQNRRMKEKKMIREANELSGDEDSHRGNMQNEYYSVPVGVFTSSSREVPQMTNFIPPYNSYSYGKCPSYTEAVSIYRPTLQQYPVVMPNHSMNMGFNGQTNVFNTIHSSHDNLRTAMSTLKVEDAEGASITFAEKSRYQSLLTDEEVKSEVTCSEKVDDDVLSDNIMLTNEYIDLDNYLQ